MKKHLVLLSLMFALEDRLMAQEQAGGTCCFSRVSEGNPIGCRCGGESFDASLCFRIPNSSEIRHASDGFMDTYYSPSTGL